MDIIEIQKSHSIEPSRPDPSTLTPHQIVKELDRFIIGQDKAKKAVAIALRNRWRRQRVSGALREEIMPNNIIMIGPTGVGKTEIARRLARLAQAPFVKVEASKFTEVGYVGRDVESMIRDLVGIAVNMIKHEMMALVEEKASSLAEERVLDILLPMGPSIKKRKAGTIFSMAPPSLPRTTPKRVVTTLIPFSFACNASASQSRLTPARKSLPTGSLSVSMLSPLSP